MSVRSFIERQPAFDLFRPFLPSDHSRQVTAEYYGRGAGQDMAGPAKILDLGCGEGDSAEFFGKACPNAAWFGVDIQDSPEVRARSCTNRALAAFDGISLPYGDGVFDLIFTRQVFEHVRHPDRLLGEVARILKPGGLFVGSVSYLEPYHSFSVFNFTPYGIMRVVQDAGLDLMELRPGIDGPTLIARQVFNRARLFEALFRRSPLNLCIAGVGRALRLRHEHMNFLKLQFAGQICFSARKPG